MTGTRTDTTPSITHVEALTYTEWERLVCVSMAHWLGKRLVAVNASLPMISVCLPKGIDR